MQPRVIYSFGLYSQRALFKMNVEIVARIVD